jgi:hypothetical protein
MKYKILVAGEPENCPNKIGARSSECIIDVQTPPILYQCASDFENQFPIRYTTCHSWMTGLDCNGIIDKCYIGQIIEIEEINDMVNRINEKRANFSFHQWEGGYNHLYDSVKSYVDLIKVLQEDDENVRIFTMSNIIPLVADLLSKDERKNLSDILKNYLSDDRMCRIASAGASYADDEDTRTVSDSARNTLDFLKEQEK